MILLTYLTYSLFFQMIWGSLDDMLFLFTTSYALHGKHTLMLSAVDEQTDISIIIIPIIVIIVVFALMVVGIFCQNYMKASYWNVYY